MEGREGTGGALSSVEGDGGGGDVFVVGLDHVCRKHEGLECIMRLKPLECA